MTDCHVMIRPQTHQLFFPSSSFLSLHFGEKQNHVKKEKKVPKLLIACASLSFLLNILFAACNENE